MLNRASLLGYFAAIRLALFEIWNSLDIDIETQDSWSVIMNYFEVTYAIRNACAYRVFLR